ncbi:hypothetical protein EVAR_12228_1 [Eumeta japonica]|uniref:Uncharacterized protein n=1 Tax=Eumeta variegata TaxID=151549 RepID=A0A4C1UH66_EUMVA|nr:hypothetical protein EVAR_12228_1 [Eumeta japonica]
MASPVRARPVLFFFSFYRITSPFSNVASSNRDARAQISPNERKYLRPANYVRLELVCAASTWKIGRAEEFPIPIRVRFPCARLSSFTLLMKFHSEALATAGRGSGGYFY